MTQHTVKATVDEHRRLILPADVAQQYQPGQEVEISVSLTEANPFLGAIGIVPGLPQGNLAFVRDLRGHDE